METIYRGQAVFPRNHEFEWVSGRLVDGSANLADGFALLDTDGSGCDDRLIHKATMSVVVQVPEPTPVSEVTPRGATLREAEKLITGDRNKNYGSPTENFDATAALWNIQLGHKLKPGESFTATDVALLMIQLKMARLKTSPSNRDHYVDIEGYAACGWECQEVEDTSA